MYEEKGMALLLSGSLLLFARKPSIAPGGISFGVGGAILFCFVLYDISLLK